MIAFDDVVVRYPTARGAKAVDGVTIAAHDGRVTAIVGPNGSGKSTLVKALLRRVSLARGSISLGGADASQLSQVELARRVAVVTQREEAVFPRVVREYVELGRFSGAGSNRRASVDTAASRAGVVELMGRRTDELSGGEWQRVRIARALAQDAPALVLDEPTSFLDIAHEMQIFELIVALAREGATVLVVSHQLNLVARFADGIVLLQNGRVAASGTPADVMTALSLEAVYQWPLVVTRDPASNAPTLVPLRRSE